jgi:hypothetical protein
MLNLVDVHGYAASVPATCPLRILPDEPVSQSCRKPGIVFKISYESSSLVILL